MNIRTEVYGVKPSAESPLVQYKNPQGSRADDLLSISVARTSGRRGNTRLEDREPMFPEPAQANWNGAKHDIELINVSGGGAMIRGPIEPALWDRIELAADDWVVECNVVWLKADRIGLEFAHTQGQ